MGSNEALGLVDIAKEAGQRCLLQTNGAFRHVMTFPKAYFDRALRGSTDPGRHFKPCLEVRYLNLGIIGA